MKFNPRLIGVGVASFLVFLIAMMPAKLLSFVIPEDLAKVRGLTGTLWNGAAMTVNVNGLELQNTDFQISPLGLLTGSVDMSLDGDWATGFVRGDIAIGITGSITIRDLKIAGPLSPVLKMLKLPGNGGNIEIDVAKLDIRDAWPAKIVGFARVTNLPLSMIGVMGGTSGSYEVLFNLPEVAADEAIPGALSDLGGPLKIAGIVTLNKPNNYAIEADITPRPDAPDDLKQGLMLIGAPEPDGSRKFNMSGSF